MNMHLNIHGDFAGVHTDTDDPERRGVEIDMNVDGDPLSQSVPLSWCRSAFIAVDGDDNTVTLAISLAGGRQFLVQVWRAEHGRVFMRVPAPGTPIPADGANNTHTYDIGRRPVVVAP